MYPIVKVRKLADKIFYMDVKAPRVAKSCLPGQFVIVKVDEKGERIPLTICDYSREDETVTIVFQTIGTSTEMMAAGANVATTIATFSSFAYMFIYYKTKRKEI